MAGVSERLPIDRLLHEGQKLIVQGLREPLGDKGGRVTADLKLFGFWLILRPLGQGVEVPGRLGPREAEKLLERGRAMFGEAGVTLRRSAVGIGGCGSPGGAGGAGRALGAGCGARPPSASDRGGSPATSRRSSGCCARRWIIDPSRSSRPNRRSWPALRR